MTFQDSLIADADLAAASIRGELEEARQRGDITRWDFSSVLGPSSGVLFAHVTMVLPARPEIIEIRFSGP